MKFLLPALALFLGLALGDLLKSSEPSPASTTLLQTLGKVTGQEFSFATVIAESTGQKILSPEKDHEAILRLLPEVARSVAQAMSRADSPAREKRRINEVSALFEEALRLAIEARPDFRCSVPETREGKARRSGYPDLRVEHLPTGAVAYLDPKLFEDRSIDSSFRTFYYEPSPDDSKVTEDAVHLLLGFPHDGKSRAWTFGEPKLVDLSQLKVTLKAEFSASNKDLYLNSAKNDSPRRKE